MSALRQTTLEQPLVAMRTPGARDCVDPPLTPPKSQLHAPSRRTPRADRPGLSRYRESEPQNFWRRFFGGVSQSPVTRGTSPAVEASDSL